MVAVMATNNAWQITPSQIRSMTSGEAKRYVDANLKAYRQKQVDAVNATDRAVYATRVAQQHGIIGGFVKGVKPTMTSEDFVTALGLSPKSKGRVTGFKALARLHFDLGCALDSTLWMRIRNSNAYQQGAVTKVINADDATLPKVEAAIAPYANADGTKPETARGAQGSTTGQPARGTLTIPSRVPADADTLRKSVKDMTTRLQKFVATYDDAAFERFARSFDKWVTENRNARKAQQAS